MEPSDLDTNEILRSFWNRPHRIRVQTYQAAGSHRRNVWLLWHWLAHGHQAAIAWPEGWMREATGRGRELSPAIVQLGPTFREIQGPAGELIVSPDSHLEADPIALYYSHPSIRAGWGMDSITHGATWPKRASSIDDGNLSSAHLRLAWCKLLEDLGYQYDFVSYLDVTEGRVDLAGRFKVIVLPQTVCLSDREARVLREFVEAGGVLVADALCGLLTETGRGRSAGILDELFGIRRDEARGYLNGRSITEIDAEYFDKPFPARLRAYDGALRYRSMVVYERGTRATPNTTREAAGGADVIMRRTVGRGRTLYLNLTPLAYSHFPFRSGTIGAAWRQVMGPALLDAGLRPRVEIHRGDEWEPWMESLLWRNGNRYCLALLKNPGDAPEAASVIEQEPREITVKLRLPRPVREIRNLRTGRVLGGGPVFTDHFTPWEASLYELALGE